MKWLLQRGIMFLIIIPCIACGSNKTLPIVTAPPLATATPDIPATSNVPTPRPTVSLNLPSDRIVFENVATGRTRDGQTFVVTTLQIVQKRDEAGERPGGYNTGNKMLVSRGSSLYWLKSSETPNKFGCGIEIKADENSKELERSSYENFGCYFGSAYLEDMDHDGELEIIASWGHGGTSCSWNSEHFYRWDGFAYQLIDDIFQQCLNVELQDLNNDGRLEVIARYETGKEKWFPVPWVDVYSYSEKQLILVNQRYPKFYDDLLVQYEQLLPQYEKATSNGWIDASNELKRRIEMAKSIVSKK